MQRHPEGSEACSRCGLSITLTLTVVAGSASLSSYLPIAICAVAVFAGVYRQWRRCQERRQLSDHTRMEKLAQQVQLMQAQFELLEWRYNRFVQHIESRRPPWLDDGGISVFVEAARLGHDRPGSTRDLGG